jgi:hypothetical protein
MFFVAILLVQWQYLEDQHEADQETILRPSNLQLQRQRCIGYYENGAESQRAECKGAERQGAEPNVRNCQIVDVELIGLLFLVTIIPLGAYLD